VVEHRKFPRWEINCQGALKLEHATGQQAVVCPQFDKATGQQAVVCPQFDKATGQQAVVCPQFDKATEELVCQVKDISYKGASFTLSAKLPLDTALRINLKFSENYTIDAQIWVAWHEVISGSNHYGVYFSRIKDADKEKIFKFISAFYPNDLKQKCWSGIREIEEKKGGEDMNDHRIFERFKRELPVRFMGVDGKEGQAQTFDVSAKGLGLVTTNELNRYAPLEIWLNVPNSTEALYTRGQVVWSKLGGNTGYRCGVELERADFMGISSLLRS